MKRSIKYIWSWWKNLWYLGKKYSYIDLVLPSVITSFLILSLILKINLPLVSSLLIITLFLNIFKKKYLILSLFFIILVFLSYFIYQIIISSYDGSFIEGNFVLNRKFNDFFIFKYRNLNFKVRILKFIKNNSFIYDKNSNYYFYLKGNLVKENNLNLFNISNQIFFNLNIKSIAILNKEPIFSISNSNNKIVSYYLNLIVLNKYDPNNLIYKKLLNLNIIHFFTISGFHFNLIYLFITFLLKKIRFKSFLTDLIAITFLVFYLALINFKVSALRSMIFIILIVINKYIFSNKFNKISLLSIAGILICLINPYTIYSYSYILSFLITLLIFIFSYLLKKINFFLKTIFLMFFIHIFSTLITHTFNEEYNIFSIFNQILVIPIIPFTYISSLIFFKWNFLIEKIIIIMDILFDLLLDISIILKFKISVELCSVLFLIPLILRKIKLHNQIRSLHYLTKN